MKSMIEKLEIFDRVVGHEVYYCLRDLCPGTEKRIVKFHESLNLNRVFIYYDNGDMTSIGGVEYKAYYKAL